MHIPEYTSSSDIQAMSIDGDLWLWVPLGYQPYLFLEFSFHLYKYPDSNRITKQHFMSLVFYRRPKSADTVVLLKKRSFIVILRALGASFLRRSGL
jgi:hypothetical protein